ncbi:hypothetical protein EVAR_64240_1 [Eumeta japonica]|uniref:Uncharacterized protein n=1 Tax=Eumeta variegata TaxID=151549 RepID=A0A4C1Z9Z4_EUMVA|nr:hypothetical protein EVAR_64240_1 [Eumeta japonica]
MDEETQTLLTQWKMDDYIELFKALFEFEDSSDLLQWLENCTDPWDTVESHWIRTAGTRLKLTEQRFFISFSRGKRASKPIESRWPPLPMDIRHLKGIPASWKRMGYLWMDSEDHFILSLPLGGESKMVEVELATGTLTHWTKAIKK